ncbi:hypothetical protein CEY02_03485 [Bacillus pumilus]|uniref:Uncharacterized protein n=1 Tax=Bacillus pumilus TaxID=1408 RepID=A0A2A5J0B5_BACPU|nr:hypothetical protein CEY02_03485 [Bacillus pumilus]
MRLPPFILLFFLHSPHFIHKVNYEAIANCHDLEKKRIPYMEVLPETWRFSGEGVRGNCLTSFAICGFEGSANS